MGNIKYVTDREGNIFLPVTSTKGVINEQGVDIDTLLTNMEDQIESQAEQIDNKASKGSLERKADKPFSTSEMGGNFAGLDSTGNLTNSGKKASDFATAAQGAKADAAAPQATTYTKTEVDAAIEGAAFLGAESGSEVIADFDPQTDTLWKAAQVLSAAEKTQVKQNLGIDGDLTAMQSAINAQNAAIETQNQAIERLNGNDVIPTDDHTQIDTTDPGFDDQKIYREPEAVVAPATDPTYYIDWMYDSANSTWKKLGKYSFPGIDDNPTAGSENLVKSNGVFDNIITNGSAFDLSAYNNGNTYANLSAALTAMNALSAAYKKGGMSIKFVQSSDNKYVQFRLMAATFSTTESDWQGVDDIPTKNSQNLITSSAVYDKTHSIETVEILTEETPTIEIKKDNNDNVVKVTDNGVEVTGGFKVTGDTEVTGDVEITGTLELNNKNVAETIENIEAVSNISEYTNKIIIADDDSNEVSSISLGNLTDEEDSQIWSNDNGSDEYARIDNKGVTAKQFYKQNGDIVGNQAYTIVVDPNGYGDFTNIVDALNNAGDTATKHVTIIVCQGTYNMPPKVSNVAPYVEFNRNLTLRGVNRNKCVLQCNIGFYDYTIGTDCAPLRLSGNVVIENLTIISSNEDYNNKIGTTGYVTERTNRKAAYCIHSDNTRQEGDIITIKNCTLIDYQMSAVGFGTRKNSTIRIENCYVQSEQAASDSPANGYGAIYGHNGAGLNVGGQRLEVLNCQIVHKTGNIAVQYLYATISDTSNLECSVCLINNTCKTQNIESALDISSAFPFPEGTCTLDSLSFGNKCPAMNV